MEPQDLCFDELYELSQLSLVLSAKVARFRVQNTQRSNVKVRSLSSEGTANGQPAQENILVGLVSVR
jgi:hypothetical protein